MSNQNNNDLGAFLAGFIIGSLVGGAVALVLAPQSGQETRDQIMTRSNALREQAGRYSNSHSEMGLSQAADGQDRVNIVLDKGQEAAMDDVTAKTDTTSDEDVS